MSLDMAGDESANLEAHTLYHGYTESKLATLSTDCSRTTFA